LVRDPDRRAGPSIERQFTGGPACPILSAIPLYSRSGSPLPSVSPSCSMSSVDVAERGEAASRWAAAASGTDVAVIPRPPRVAQLAVHNQIILRATHRYLHEGSPPARSRREDGASRPPQIHLRRRAGGPAPIGAHEGAVQRYVGCVRRSARPAGRRADPARSRQHVDAPPPTAGRCGYRRFVRLPSTT
jgi:hypothetical protein